MMKKILLSSTFILLFGTYAKADKASKVEMALTVAPYALAIDDDKPFRTAYFGKVRSIAFNLQNESNPNFLEKFENHKISVKKLPYMTHYEIFPEMYEPIFEKLAQKHMPKEPDLSVDGLFKCGKCKTMKTTFYCLQTRSADEPMTAFINCLKCGNRWKE